MSSKAKSISLDSPFKEREEFVSLRNPAHLHCDWLKPLERVHVLYLYVDFMFQILREKRTA
jgi:hypothetical protein